MYFLLYKKINFFSLFLKKRVITKVDFMVSLKFKGMKLNSNVNKKKYATLNKNKKKL
jgi:hypothetical protein